MVENQGSSSMKRYWYQKLNGRCKCPKCNEVYKYRKGTCACKNKSTGEPIDNVTIDDGGSSPEAKERLSTVWWHVSEKLETERTRLGDWVAVLSLGLVPVLATVSTSDFRWVAIGLLLTSLALGVAVHVLYVMALNYNYYWRLPHYEKRQTVPAKDRDRVYWIHLTCLKYEISLLRLEGAVFAIGLIFVAVAFAT
ncbi:MAG: hypothetical protein PHP64_07395 [Actinomycetota bacterium]|nr:hypothetical protein [Actinomycetota bacterium]